MYRALCQSCLIPDNLGLMIRHQWQELKTSLMYEFENIVDKVTDGNKGYLIDGPVNREGYYEYTVFTSHPKYSSKILVRPEPDRSSDRAVADALKQAEYGWVLYDELTQLKKVTYETLRSRLRRKSRAIGEMPIASVGLTNPPTKGHWLYDLVRENSELEDGDPGKILVVRSSMLHNPFLRPDYVEREIRRFRNDPIGMNMYIHGMDGVDIDGTPVFKGSFNTAINTSQDIKPNIFGDLYVGMDFGFHHSTAVFGQTTYSGHVHILEELRCKEIFALDFGKEVLAFLKQRFPRIPFQKIHFFGDPAGRQKSDKGDPTIVILRDKLGIRVESKVLDIDPGLNLIRRLFSELREHNNVISPRLRIHGRCEELITALSGGYYYKSSSDGRAKPKPHKDGFFDHMVDAMRYMVTNIFHPTSEELRGKRGRSKGGYARRPAAVTMPGE